MRTYEEILKRIKDIEERDFFGFESNDLILRLPYALAKPLLKSDITEAAWEETYHQAKDYDSILNEIKTYMHFAWEKANGCRGLSAARSMSHYNAWVWLAGVPDSKFGDLTDYEFYGKDNLVAICNHFGIDSSQWDDGIRVN